MQRQAHSEKYPCKIYQLICYKCHQRFSEEQYLKKNNKPSTFNSLWPCSLNWGCENNEQRASGQLETRKFCQISAALIVLHCLCLALILVRTLKAQMTFSLSMAGCEFSARLSRCHKCTFQIHLHYNFLRGTPTNPHVSRFVFWPFDKKFVNTKCQPRTHKEAVLG